MLENILGAQKDGGQHVMLILFYAFHSPVASWISHVSFMRWGFEGMLQVQFRGAKYPIIIANKTEFFDGIYVS